MSDLTAKERLRRLTCEMFGCIYHNELPCCDRCGSHIYEGFIDRGKLHPVFNVIWRLRQYVRKALPKRCSECHKRYWFGYTEYVCSEKCHENWLPF